MITKKLTEMRAKIERIISNANTNVDKASKALEKANAALEKAKEAVEAAYENANVEEYHAAKENLRALEDAVELHSIKIKKLSGSSLVSETEYKKDIQTVRSELDAVVAKSKKEVFDLVKKISAISDDVDSTIEYGNALLSDLQNKVYKDKPLANGWRVEEKYVDNDIYYLAHEASAVSEKWGD